MRLIRIICCAAAVVAMTAPGARADEWNKLTYLTFSGPVQVPGATLPAGTYMFKLADTWTSRHVVQIFSKDGSKIYTTLFAVPDERLQPTGKNVVLFSERPAGQPVAVRAWFYPGDLIGDEFVYPKTQALAIARSTHKSVLTTGEDQTAEANNHNHDWMKSAKVSRIDENGNMTSADHNANNTSAASENAQNTSGNQPAMAGNPRAPERQAATSNEAMNTTDQSPATSTTASSAKARHHNARSQQSIGTSGQTADNTSTNANRHHRARKLPATASSLPAFELLSVLSLAGAFGVRRFRIRMSESA